MLRTKSLSTTLIICTQLFFSTFVYATPYTFSVDSFSTAGSQPSSFSDNFDDESIGSSWDIYDPTAVEHNGQITLSNPGTAYATTLGSLHVDGQMSYIAYNSTFQLANGVGNFYGKSTWTSVPDIDQFYNMHVSIDGSDEDINIGVYNFSPDAAGLFGTTPGLAVFVMRYLDLSSGDFDFQSHAINPDDLANGITLRLTFDDASNQFIGDFSLDAEQSYQTPFAAMTPSALGSEFNWVLGGESWDVTPVPLPGSIWLFGAAIVSFWRLRHSIAGTTRLRPPCLA